MTNVTALKEYMDASGMTVTHIAEKSGILRETFYNRMKTGDFKLSEICALSRVLGLSKYDREKIFFANDSELK